MFEGKDIAGVPLMMTTAAAVDIWAYVVSDPHGQCLLIFLIFFNLFFFFSFLLSFFLPLCPSSFHVH
ncbi:hypothetical protein F4814DRAFT_406692 [Daldinia grandis]|nr:hypothetical protein F4814DRAFT_406692 [Daldinia grandis]